MRSVSNLFVLLCVSNSGIAFAQITDFSISPADPVMGETVKYTALGNAANVVAYEWEYRFSAGNGDWVDSGGTTRSVSFYETIPGQWDIQLTVTYAAVGKNPPPPTIIQKTITVQPAVKFKVIGGINTPVPLDQPIVIGFRIDAAARSVGTALTGILPQELIINKLTHAGVLVPPALPDDANWSPSLPNDDFQIPDGTNMIIATKITNLDARTWGGIKNGTAFYSSTQKLRLRYVDPTGVVQVIDLGNVTLLRTKVDNSNWSISVANPTASSK